jgi:hypothetical protein
MEGTFIEVQAYGDFDMLYTDSFWYTSEKRDVKSITRAFCSINGLPGTSGLPYNMLRDSTEAFKKYLKKEGFRPISTKAVYFSE